jgi:hypothetical protein
MKKKLLIYSIIVLTLSLLFSSIAMAVCPPGKIEVTIVNPAGKVMTICVPEHVVDNIGGPGDVVIPAICPCFTQEFVEELLNIKPTVCEQREGYTSISQEACTLIKCYDGENRSVFEAEEGPEDFDRYGLCGEFCSPLPCIKEHSFNTVCCAKNACKFISEEEADACVAILSTFVEPATCPCWTTDQLQDINNQYDMFYCEAPISLCAGGFSPDYNCYGKDTSGTTKLFSLGSTCPPRPEAMFCENNVDLNATLLITDLHYEACYSEIFPFLSK